MDRYSTKLERLDNKSCEDYKVKNEKGKWPKENFNVLKQVWAEGPNQMSSN